LWVANYANIVLFFYIMASTEVRDEMLDINEPLLYDESISSMNLYEYTPQTQANNNTAGQQIAW